MIDIKDYGWDKHFEDQMNEDHYNTMLQGRVIVDHGTSLKLLTIEGELDVNKPVYMGNDIQIAVGDWVLFEQDSKRVKVVLERKTKFSRAAAGVEVKEQIIAANIDCVFLMQSLNKDFNMKRLERYLVAAWQSGAVPVVVLTKADCCSDISEKVIRVTDIAPGVDVAVISCITRQGIDEIQKYFKKGTTVALLGSSGVGKSTLVNTLAGEEILKTKEIREDDSHGRHATTHREICLLPQGGLILDTPGMRELSLWDTDKGMKVMFGDIEEMARECRFNNCRHQDEPGCAVKEALISGVLDEARWENWMKLQKEIAHTEAKKQGKLRQKDKQWGKMKAQYQKEIKKRRYQ